jgi:hypothetical protein
MHKLLWVWLVFTVPLGLGQEVRLELGFRGEMVAEKWNPLRLIRRDMGPATLTLEFDQGTLREGNIPVFYEVKLKSAQGLDVFEDDIYIPHWRSFVWRLADESKVYASGSFNRQMVNTQPIDLIVSKTPEFYLNAFGENSRIVQVDDLLPKRLASYDGVHSLVLDGSIPMPTLEALSSAASAGVQVIYVEDTNSTYDYDLFSLLAPDTQQRLGAGWLIRSSRDGIKASLALLPVLDTTQLQETYLVKQSMIQNLPSTVLLTMLGAYVLLILLSIRFFGAAGLVTAFLLTALASAGAWIYLRPPAQQIASQSLYINSGKLAKVERIYQITQLPQANLQLPVQAHPTTPRSYIQREGLEIKLSRWSQETLKLRPSLSSATLLLEGNLLRNESEVNLQHIYVNGLGQQPDLSPGESLELSPGEESTLYQNLLPLLPIGTVLAQHNSDLHLAIPNPELLVQP